MSRGIDTRREATLVAAQVGRPPRRPWRVAGRCTHDRPTVIVSPSLLEDATRFPNYAWLTCPWLIERCSRLESEGAAARWAERAAADPEVAFRLADVDARLRRERREESGGTDACVAVGIAGQRDPLGVKCLHAHTALALLGFDDPIGEDVLGRERECPDDRCARLAAEGDDDE